MDDLSTLNEDITDAALSGLLRLHDAVGRREPGRPEAALSPDELLSRFRAADPTGNAACLPWLLRTYSTGGYRLEDLSKAYDTLAVFTRLRGLLPNTSTIDGETRNPRKLGSHTTLASLWKAVAPLIEAERLAQEDCSSEQEDTYKERALAQSRVLHRSNRMVVAVPMTEEASCWWGQGTQWCTAARNNNAFGQYHKDAPLIVICLRKVGDLPARKLQLHVHAGNMQFMDENDARVKPELVSERWQDLEAVLHWVVGRNGEALTYVPEYLRTEAMCLAAVAQNGGALRYVPWPLHTEAMCLASVGGNGRALYYVPKLLRTEAICTSAVGRDGLALEFVPDALRTEAMCLAAIGRDGGALEYVPELLRTEAICTAAVGRSGWAIAHVPKRLLTDAICTVEVGRDGQALQHIPESLRTEAICTIAVGRYGYALEYVPKLLRTEAICTTAVGRDGLALEYVPEPLRTEVICTIAVGRSGWAIAYVPKRLLTEVMCLAAVDSSGMVLSCVPEPLRTEAICLTAVGRDGEALQYVPEHLRAKVLCVIASNVDKHKSVSVTSEWKSHDLLLEGLEDCLNKSQHGHQNTFSSTKSGMG